MSLTKLFADRAKRMTASEIRELLKLLDQPGLLSFAGGIPDPALFPADAFGQAFATATDPEHQATALQYSVSEGYLPLRQWLVQDMRRIGIECSVDNILITSGSQQALDYLGKLMLGKNDTALVGWPTYLGALGAFNAYEPVYDQLSIKGNRSAEDYANTAAKAGGQVKFAYVSADFANPTGETIDARGREDLLNLADALDCAVIEDGAYQPLRYDGVPVAPILAMDIARHGDIEKTRTIYCGSFSKVLSPGLRVGWVVAAKPVIDQLVLITQAGALHSATITQMAVNTVARNGLQAQVDKIRSTYRERRDAMLAALQRHMPAGVQWTRPEGGMFVWVTLPAGMDGADLLQRAIAEQSLAFVPGRAFYADDSGGNTLRLSFSCASPEKIDEGMRRLGILLRDA